MRIVVIQGSARNENNCPGQNGKTFLLVDHVIANASKGVTFDRIDLSIDANTVRVQPCKACVSTANGYHCHMPCSCYGPKAINKSQRKIPDFMHDEKVYDRLSRADGFIVFSPVNWYAPSTQVKAFFDRLVCVSLTLTRDQAVGFGIGKDPDKTRAAYKAKKYDKFLKNHLDGKVGAFYSHGDNGADDYIRAPIPKALNIVKEKTLSPGPRESMMPQVWQCRYSGIWVPDELVVGITFGEGTGYPDNHDRMAAQKEMFDQATQLVERLIVTIKMRKNPETVVDKSEPMKKAFIPPAFRDKRHDGQMFGRDRFPLEKNSIMKLVTQKPPAWSTNRYLDRPIFTAKGAVADLGLDPATSSSWAQHIDALVKNSAHEGELRQAFFERALNEGLNPTLRQTLFQRTRSLYGNRMMKAQVYSLDDVQKALTLSQPAPEPESERFVIKAGRGGNYHRRVPHESGKGFRYYYDPSKYAERKDAHMSGEEMTKYSMGQELSRALTGAGSKGCGIEELHGLAKKYGGKELSGLLKDRCMEKTGDVSFMGGRFYAKPKAAEPAEPKREPAVKKPKAEKPEPEKLEKKKKKPPVKKAKGRNP